MEKLLEMMEELAEAGIPSAYDHFAEGESPEPPFITYVIPGADNFSADGRAYFKVDEVHVELYTDAKDPDLENRVEDVLDSHDVYYSKSEVWIESEKLYEVMYTFQMKRDAAAPAAPMETDPLDATEEDTESGTVNGTEADTVNGADGTDGADGTNDTINGTVNGAAETEDTDEPDTGTTVEDRTEEPDGGTANEE